MVFGFAFRSLEYSLTIVKSGRICPLRMDFLETKSKFTLETGLVGLVFKHEKQKQNLVLDLFENRITLSIQVLLWNWKSMQSRLWQETPGCWAANC